MSTATANDYATVSTLVDYCESPLTISFKEAYIISQSTGTDLTGLRVCVLYLRASGALSLNRPFLLASF